MAAAVGYGAYHYGYRQATKTSAADKVQLYTCPMHPSVISKKPGNCPICGMKLVPVEEAQPKQKSEVSGHGVMEISTEKQQLIGVVVSSVARRPLSTAVRAVGQVVVDEQRLSDVHTKIEGWVEKLYANQTGKIVRKGQPLLTIYSPELVSTQQEMLVALRARERVKDSPFPEVRRSGDSMVAAARQRLRLWDVSEAEIARLEKTGETKKALTIYAPATGYVMEKMVVEGMRVMPEMTLYRLVDLSRVWVEADIYEYEAPIVTVGQQAKLTLAAHPGQTLSGRVTYIYPMVETMTRTLKARLEFANPGLMLKPGMYTNVVIEAPAGEALAIPEEAVLDSGTRKIVFVKEGEGTFIPREVTLGARAGGYYPVLSGLKEGELVVSSPNFLLDSESRLQAALQAARAGGEHAGHGQ
jgi:RND family efflux transporter MFP subunit